MSITQERVRQLHDSYKEAVVDIDDLYLSSTNDHEREELMKAKLSIDETYGSLFRSYFVMLDERHFEMDA